MKRRTPGALPILLNNQRAGNGNDAQIQNNASSADHHTSKKTQKNNHKCSTCRCPTVAALIFLGVALGEVAIRSGPFDDLVTFSDGIDHLRSLSSYLDTSALDFHFRGTTTRQHDGANKHQNVVFITVKTTRRNHQKRLQSILNTYWNFAPQTIVFISDNHTDASSEEPSEESQYPMITADDPPWKERFSLVDSACPQGHGVETLCCKTAAEISYYHRHSTAQWMCHLDDDTYVNYPTLVEYLEQFNATGEHFIGYANKRWPVHTIKEHKRVYKTKGLLRQKIGAKLEVDGPSQEENEKAGLVFVNFSFGASWCLSRPLVQRGIHLFSNLVAECQAIEKPDDIIMYSHLHRASLLL